MRRGPYGERLYCKEIICYKNSDNRKINIMRTKRIVKQMRSFFVFIIQKRCYSFVNDSQINIELAGYIDIFDKVNIIYAINWFNQ